MSAPHVEGMEIERLPDTSDAASQQESLHLSAALAEQRLRNRPQQVRNPDGTWPHEDCVECGNPIPPQRLENGRIRCTPCESALERRNQFYRR